MSRLSIVIDTSALEILPERLLRLSDSAIAQVGLRAVNEVAKRGFELSVRRMTDRVNLTEPYVRERMDVEPANDPRKPEARIIAFRAGGRRPATRPVNIRQYAMVQLQAPVRFTNSDPRIAKGRMGMNPRKPGSTLPWKRRVGDPQAGIPIGMKAAGVSVEVLKGQRKPISYAFQRRMPNGEILVMARKKGQRGVGKGKGKIEPITSLSVWQLFRSTIPNIYSIVADDLSKTVGDDLEQLINEVIK